MRNTLRLGKHRGIVCIIETDHHFEKPEAYALYWPTRFPACDFDDRDLAESTILRAGYGYSLKVPGIGFWLDCPIQGNQRAVKVELVPVPCPKQRKGIETRWYNGDWQKYLKSTGWQNLYAMPDYLQAKELPMKESSAVK